MSYLRHGAIAIVSQRLSHQCHATWTITFVRDLFIADACFLTGATTNRAIDRVIGHVAGLGISNRFAQACIAFGIAAAAACRDGDLLNKLREQFAALGVERAFLVLDTVPFRW